MKKGIKKIISGICAASLVMGVAVGFSGCGSNISVGVAAGEHGSVLGGGKFKKGITTPLTAAPEAGYGFYGWKNEATGAYESYENPFVFKVSKKIKLIAVFDEAYTITLNAGNSARGGVAAIVALDGKVDGGRAASVTTREYAKGRKVALQAIAKKGYQFVGWTHDGVEKTEQGNKLYFEATKNETVEVQFEPTDHTQRAVTVTQNNTYRGKVEQEGEGYVGTNYKVLATANQGYKFAGWKKDGAGEYLKDVNNKVIGASYSFEISEANVNLQACFEPAKKDKDNKFISSSVTIYKDNANGPGQNGAVTVTGDAREEITSGYIALTGLGTGKEVTAYAGTVVTLSATENKEGAFLGWKMQDQKNENIYKFVSLDLEYTFTPQDGKNYVFVACYGVGSAYIGQTSTY